MIRNHDLRRNGPEAGAVVDGRNGLSFAKGSPESLAAVLSRLIETPELALSLGRQAMWDVEHTLSLDRMVDGIEAAVTGSLRHPI